MRWGYWLIGVVAVLVLSVAATSAAGEVTVCPSGCDHDTIQAAIDAAAPGATITVASGTYTEQLTVAREVTLRGDGADTTVVDGAGAGTVLTVTTDGDLTLEDVTVKGGSTQDHGGGIRNDGRVALVRVTVAQNRADTFTGRGGGIYSTGPLTVADSIIAGNRSRSGGGGIYVTGAPVVIEDTELTGNEVNEGTNDFRGGGGLHATGAADVAVARSVFASNTTEFTGGAVTIRTSGTRATFSDVTFDDNLSRFGGALVTQSSSRTVIERSTFSSNRAGTGGAIRASAPVVVTNSTFSGNDAEGSGGAIAAESAVEVGSVTFVENTGRFGGGISSFSSGRTTVQNSILWGNTATDLGADCAGEITSDGAVWVGDPVDCTISGVPAVTGVDPQLGALADNGGLTATHALDPASPAVDAGDTTLEIDQRGEPRPSGTSPDVGAFEVQQSPHSDDIDAPTWNDPSLEAREVRDDRLTLAWSGATDDEAVTAYEVERDGDVITTVPAPETSVVVTGLRPDTVHEFRVQALDAVGNRSTDGPNTRARTAPGLPDGHLLASPTAPSQAWQMAIPTPGLDSARAAGQVVVVASTGDDTPVTAFVDLLTPAAIDIDRDDSDDVHVSLRLDAGSGPLPEPVLTVERLSDPGPEDVQVLALVPLPEEFATDTRDGLLVVGFGTVAADGAAGGTLPVREEITLTVDGLDVLTHTIGLRFDTDVTPNPLEFFAGTAKTVERVEGGETSGLVAMRVDGVPSSVETTLAVDASSLGAPEAEAELVWSWRAPEDEADPDIVFSYLENERRRRDAEADHHTEIIVDGIDPVTDVHARLAPDSEGLLIRLTHDQPDTFSNPFIRELGIQHRRRDGLEVAGGFQRITDGLTLEALVDDDVITLDGGRADVTMQLEVEHPDGDLLGGSFTNPIRWLFAAMRSTDRVTVATDGGAFELGIGGQEPGDLVLAAGQAPGQLRFPDGQSWPDTHPRSWISGSDPDGHAQLGIYDGADASTLALINRRARGLTVDLDPERMSQAIGLTADRPTELDVEAQLDGGALTETATTFGCAASLDGGTVTVGIDPPDHYELRSAGGRDLDCHGRRGTTTLALTADRFPDEMTLDLDLGSESSGSLEAILDDAVSHGARVVGLRLLLTDTEGFTPRQLLGAPAVEVGVKAESLPSTEVAWVVEPGNGTTIEVDATHAELVPRNLGVYLATATSDEAFQPPLPPGRPLFDQSGPLRLLPAAKQVVHLWESERLSVLGVGVDGARRADFVMDGDGHHEAHIEEQRDRRDVVVDLALPAGGHFLDGASFVGWCRLAGLGGTHTLTVDLPTRVEVATDGEPFPAAGCHQLVTADELALEVLLDGAELPSGTAVELAVEDGEVRFRTPSVAGHVEAELRDRSGSGLADSPFGSPIRSALVRAEQVDGVTGSWDVDGDDAEVSLQTAGEAAVGQVELSTADEVPRILTADDERHQTALHDEGADGAASLTTRIIGLRSASVRWDGTAEEPLEVSISSDGSHQLSIDGFIAVDADSAPEVDGEPVQVKLDALVDHLGPQASFTTDLRSRYRVTGPAGAATLIGQAVLDPDPADGEPGTTIDLVADGLPHVTGIDALTVFEGPAAGALVDLSGGVIRVDLAVSDPRSDGVLGSGSHRLHLHATGVPDGFGFAMAGERPDPGDLAAAGHLTFHGTASARIGRLFVLSDSRNSEPHFGSAFSRLMVDLHDVPERVDLEFSPAGDGTAAVDLVFTDAVADRGRWAGPDDRIGRVEFLAERARPSDIDDDPTAELGGHHGGFTAVERSDYVRQVDDDYWPSSIRDRLDQLDGATFSIPVASEPVPAAPDEAGPETRTVALTDYVTVDRTGRDDTIARVAVRLSEVHAVRVRLDAQSETVELERPKARTAGPIYLALEKEDRIEYGAAPEKLETPEDAADAPTVEDDDAEHNWDSSTDPTYRLPVLRNDCAERDEEGDCTDEHVVDPATLAVLEDPSHGDVTVEDGELVYTPHFRGHVGWDQFTYEVCAEDGGCGYAVAQLLVREPAYLAGGYARLGSQPHVVTVTMEVTPDTEGGWDPTRYRVKTSEAVAGGQLYLGPRTQPPVTVVQDATAVEMLSAPTEVTVVLEPRAQKPKSKGIRARVGEALPRFFLKIDTDGDAELIGVHQTADERMWFGVRGEDVDFNLRPGGLVDRFIEGPQDAGDYGGCDRVLNVDTCLLLIGLKLEAETDGDVTGQGLDGFFVLAPLTSTTPSARADGAAAFEYLPLVTLIARDLKDLYGRAELQLDPLCFLCLFRPLDVEVEIGADHNGLLMDLWDRGFDATWSFPGSTPSESLHFPASYEDARRPWRLLGLRTFDPYAAP